jgi:hypothetical protein
MEGFEVRDLIQAYHCLTGRELPRRPFLVRARMALPSAVYRSLSGMSNTWSQRAVRALQPSTASNGQEPAGNTSGTIGNPGTHSRKLELEGLVAASWFASIEEYRQRRGQRQTDELWALFQSSQPADAIQRLTAWTSSNDRSLQKLFLDLGEITLDSVDRVIWLLEAYEGAVTASVHQGYAVMMFQELLEALKSVRDQATPSVPVTAIRKAMIAVIRDLVEAEVQTLMARDLVVLARNVDGNRPVLEEDLDQATQLFHGAALANMEFLESWLISDAVERTGKPAGEIRKNLARKDADYRLALMNLRLPESDSFLPVREGRTRQMARLSGALSSFFASSTLMASRYSLRRHTGEDSTDKALDAALVSAEDKARENAARALATLGFVPQGALVAYQIALVQQRSQERRDRWKALESYWRSSMWSQVAMVLWETTGKRGNQHRPSTRRRTP